MRSWGRRVEGWTRTAQVRRAPVEEAKRETRADESTAQERCRRVAPGARSEAREVSILAGPDEEVEREEEGVEEEGVDGVEGMEEAAGDADEG